MRRIALLALAIAAPPAFSQQPESIAPQQLTSNAAGAAPSRPAVQGIQAVNLAIQKPATPTCAPSQPFYDIALVSGRCMPIDGDVPKRTGPNCADGRFSAAGDFRKHPDGSKKPHLGLDLLGAVGDNVYAASKGTFAYYFSGKASGLQAVIEHTGGKATQYFHLSARVDTLKDGDVVSEGAVVGYTGTSGNAENTTCPHVHFQLSDFENGSVVGGSASDPVAWLETADDNNAVLVGSEADPRATPIIETEVGQ